MTTETQTTTLDSPSNRFSELARTALERISVAQPYFALTDIARAPDGESITATVPESPPVAPEVGAIEAAQVARHLAILGSCAAALSTDTDQRHHYLAVGASYERLGEPMAGPSPGPFTAVASAHWQDKRTATATMTLTDASGTPMNRLDVTYAVMKPRMFERLNPRVERTAQVAANAEPVIVERARGAVVADYGPVPAELCAGHFPNHPVAPIAIVMGRLVLTARHALCSHMGTEVAYRVEAGEVEASGLAQPGQQLVLEATYDRENPDGSHLISGQALADGMQVGAVQVHLAAIPAAE